MSTLHRETDPAPFGLDGFVVLDGAEQLDPEQRALHLTKGERSLLIPFDDSDLEGDAGDLRWLVRYAARHIREDSDQEFAKHNRIFAYPSEVVTDLQPFNPQPSLIAVQYEPDGPRYVMECSGIEWHDGPETWLLKLYSHASVISVVQPSASAWKADHDNIDRALASGAAA